MDPMVEQTQVQTQPRTKRGVIYELKRHRVLYLMSVPAMLMLLLFSYIPFAGIWMAFTDFNVVDGIFGSAFVGLDNFKFFFDTGGMGWKVTYNTLFINFWGIILGILVPVTLAILLHEVRGVAFKKMTQSMMFFPYFISWVVVGAIVYGIFSTDVGVANRVLELFGMDPIRWYSEPQYWKVIIIASSVWKWSGYSSIIYLAAMANFDGSLYESAKVDGATKFQRILYLTLPMLKPTIIILTLMSVGRIFYGDFGMVYGIVGNNPVLIDEVSVIDTYVYQSMRTLGFSYATAIGLFQSVMGLILVILANQTAKKINDGEGLF
ncbi:ABC transporter permease [Paenibacillus daejeonensis]|uniref:ABC transporter permease n=1 Tax=Paenibacillus daejeonensis TaxID=135193 RepID=UPI000370E7BE|nr:ABC transporter permease subunit [Paenibacillus daejeonensis]